VASVRMHSARQFDPPHSLVMAQIESHAVELDTVVEHATIDDAIAARARKEREMIFDARMRDYPEVVVVVSAAAVAGSLKLREELRAAAVDARRHLRGARRLVRAVEARAA
jgi:hypothetical protein